MTMFGIIGFILVIVGLFGLDGDRWYVGAIEIVLGLACAGAGYLMGEDD